MNTKKILYLHVCWLSNRSTLCQSAPHRKEVKDEKAKKHTFKISLMISSRLKILFHKNDTHLDKFAF